MHKTILCYFLIYRKSGESKNPQAVTTNKAIIKLSLQCSVSDSKKSKFIKKQKTEGSLSMIGEFHILVPLVI